MINTSILLEQLHINGINENSSVADVDKILSALKYSPQDKAESMQFLEAKGWLRGGAGAQPLTTDSGNQNVSSVQNTTPSTPKAVPTFEQYKANPAKYQTGVSASTNKHSSVIAIVIVVIFIGLMAGAIAFAFVKKIGPFAVKSYSEETFFSDLLTTASKIKSSSYKASAAFDIGERDEGAEPFSVRMSNEAELREQYQNDAKRSQDISTIVSLLGSYKYSYGKTQPKPYPATLKILFADAVKKGNYYSRSLSITDPVTEKEYEYSVTNNGNDFRLSTTFETQNAINEVKNAYRYVATTTIVSGKKVTFTKDSYPYLYLPSEPVKPFLVEIGEQMRYVPTDVKVLASVSATSEWTEDSADWIFNFNGEGSFGDLSYKVNADALKKDKDYYVKINNIPSILLGEISSMKGKWIKITPKDETGTLQNSYSPFGSLSRELQGVEKEYKENREMFVELIKLAASIADEEKLVVFKESPKSDKVDGRDLIRYELSIRKDAILPFYTKLMDAVSDEPKFRTVRNERIIADPGFIEYLKSPEFDAVFDYFDKNTNFTLWVDRQGFPAILQESLRIIPPPSAKQLSDKQANIVLKLEFTDINETTNIEAPKESTPIEQVMKEYEKSRYGYDVSGTAQLKANLSSIRAQAEVVYSNNSSYGKSPFPLGACKQTTGTLYGDADVFKLIKDATQNNTSSATCVSKGTSGNVTSYAVSVPLLDDPTYSWCIDSTGVSKQIKGKITDSVCK